MLSGLPLFTEVHVYLSLIGILSGFAVALGLLASKRLDGWTALFLASTAASVVTGFLLPAHRFLPSHAFGILTTIALALAIYARYGRNFAGAWRVTYVVSAMLALYLNTFILVVQLFEKEPALEALAPTKSEPPFKVTQLVVLAVFIVLTIAAAKRFRNTQAHTPSAT